MNRIHHILPGAPTFFGLKSFLSNGLMMSSRIVEALCQAPVDRAGRLTRTPLQLVHFGYTISYNAPAVQGQSLEVLRAK
jgi:hypothetical protein